MITCSCFALLINYMSSSFTCSKRLYFQTSFTDSKQKELCFPSSMTFVNELNRAEPSVVSLLDCGSLSHMYYITCRDCLYQKLNSATLINNQVHSSGLFKLVSKLGDISFKIILFQIQGFVLSSFNNFFCCCSLKFCYMLFYFKLVSSLLCLCIYFWTLQSFVSALGPR